MARFARRSFLVLVDIALLSAAYWLAFLLRFDGHLPLQMWKRLVFTWPYVVAFQYAVLYFFAIPRFAWRYVSLREVYRVALALGLAGVVLLVVRLISGAVQDDWPYAQYAFVPIGVIIMDIGLAFLGVTGARAGRRLAVEQAEAHSRRPAGSLASPERTLLIGAGHAGVTVAKEMAARPDLRMQLVGFLDDDRSKHGSILQGVPVLGSTEHLRAIVRRTRAKQVVIAIASASGRDIRRIVALCDRAGIQPKIVPGIGELLDGRANISRIRSVSIEDLLGREPVHLELDLIRGFVEGKRVLVTGAGGSIGSELCRQVARFRPARLLLVEQAEFNLFTIHQELIKAHPELQIEPIIADVCDSARVEAVFQAARPQVVFHAAAHKHVPMMEWNPGEAVKNNVFGTRKVADAADRHHAEAFVMISTDKAVNPTSIMGATKRVAEMYIQGLSRRSKTKYVAVRFGNVLGSTGSVIPIFKQQIAAGGPVTVTHPDMKRYFMTIPEASQLVMQAAAMGQGGEIFVLDMGEPVKIVDLAESLIRLSGFEPGVDIDVEFSGIRPGEKLFEELGFDAEQMDKTRHEKIFVGRLAPGDLTAVERGLLHLAEFTGTASPAEVRAALGQVVPEMREPDQDEPVASQPRRRRAEGRPAPAPTATPVAVASAAAR